MMMSQQSNDLNPSNFTDRFDFSVTANHMAILNAAILETPEANIAKIQLIKEELASGRYQVNHAHIAAKLTEYAPVLEALEIA